MGKEGDSNASSKKKQRHEEPQSSAVISYNLSDPTFITKKWTKLPRMIAPSIGQKTKPWACFKKRDEEKFLYYPKGQVAAKFEKDGSGKVFYINGTTAIELSQSILGLQRVILYGEVEQPDSEPTLLGWLDAFGNCILGDSDGKNIIANYSQLGGYVVYKDEFLKWRWDHFTTKRRLMTSSNEMMPVKRKKSRESLGKNTSQKLLDLHIKKAYDKGTLKLQEGKLYFKCKVSECLSLWIFSQEKIDLSFASNSFITRLDVGITVQHDDGSHVRIMSSKHQVL